MRIVAPWYSPVLPNGVVDEKCAAKGAGLLRVRLPPSSGSRHGQLFQRKESVEDAQNDPAQFAKDVHEAEELVQHLTQEIRTTSYLLHPPMLDESGISSALSWYVKGLAERSSLEIDLKVPANFGRLPSDMELLIFRLVQESVTNIHRHSGSKTALIRIEREENTVDLSIEDQGRGMSPERLTEIESHGTGVGIRGMSERVRHFRGDLVIESNGSGTRVHAIIPLTTFAIHKGRTPEEVLEPNACSLQ